MIFVLILLIGVCAWIGYAHPELIKVALALAWAAIALLGLGAILRDITIRL